MTMNYQVAIIDYGMGNVKSIENAIAQLDNVNVNITDNAEQILSADCLILPGVGAFPDAMKQLHERKLVDVLHQAVLVQRKPTLGICRGMQLLFDHSEEITPTKGLGWIPGKIVQMKPGQNLRVPHVGWNSLILHNNSPFFAHLEQDRDYYFVHSFYADCDQSFKLASFNYGVEMTAAVQNDNVVGMQFHPEKSQKVGLSTLNAFFNWARQIQCEYRRYA